MPTAWPDVRLVDSFEPSIVGACGAPVAVTCAVVDLDDDDETSVFVEEAALDVVAVAAIALADEVEVVTIYDTGCQGRVIVPERVARAASFSPEQILYRDSLSSLETVVHSESAHEYASSPRVKPWELCCEHRHERSSAPQLNPELL